MEDYLNEILIKDEMINSSGLLFLKSGNVIPIDSYYDYILSSWYLYTRGEENIDKVLITNDLAIDLEEISTMIKNNEEEINQFSSSQEQED